GIELGAFGNVLFSITTIFPCIDPFFVLFFIIRFRIAVCKLFRIPITSSSQLFQMSPSWYFFIFTDPFHSYFVWIITTLSLFSNGLLLFIIYSTPSANLGAYRYLLVVFAVCDITTSLGHAGLQPVMHMTSTGFYGFPRATGNMVYFGRPMDTPLCLLFIATYYQTFLVIAYHFLYRYKIVTSAHVPPEIIDIYGVDLREPNTGFCVVAVKQYVLESGELRYHLPTLMSMTTSLSLFVATAVVILYCIVRTNSAISSRNFNLTEKTRRLQRALFNSLLIQTAVPWFFSYIPLSMVLIFPAVTGINLGAFGNLLFSITAIFPCVDPFFVLFFITRYRIAVIRLFRISIGSTSDASIGITSKNSK
ncbi:hypothetical protein PFISCL1PPCAC_14158, partial [Pristionchus fissidentatus]